MGGRTRENEKKWTADDYAGSNTATNDSDELDDLFSEDVASSSSETTGEWDELFEEEQTSNIERDDFETRLDNKFDDSIAENKYAEFLKLRQQKEREMKAYEDRLAGAKKGALESRNPRECYLGLSFQPKTKESSCNNCLTLEVSK